MKNKTFTLLLICALSVAFTGCATSHSKAWEYKAVTAWVGDPPTNVEAQINTLTEQGWHLVSVSTADKNEAPYALILFKRPK
jgi:hypothetical protein